MAEKIVLDVEVTTDNAVENVNALTTSIVELEEEQKNLKKAIKDGTITQEQYSQAIAENQEKLSKNKGERKQNIKIIQAEEKSISRLKSEVSRMTKERDKVTTATEKGRKKIAEYNKKIDENNKIIKENVSQLDQQRLNIGNYKDGVSDALKEQEVFGISIEKVNGFFKSGAGLVGAAVGVVAALGKAYTSSARGAEDLARATDRLGAATTQFGNVLANTTKGKGFFDRLLRGAQEQILGVSAAIEGDLIVETKAALRQLEILELDQERRKKQQLQRAEILRQIRDDDTRSYEDRIEANNELSRVVNERESETIKFQEDKLKLYKTLLAFDEENIALQTEIKRIEFEIADAREENEGFRSEQLINVNTLLREQSVLLEHQAKLEEYAAKRQENQVIEVKKNQEEIRVQIGQTNDTIEDQGDKVVQNTQKIANSTEEIISASLNAIQGLSTSTFDILFTLNQNRLDKELEAAGDNDKKKEAIERKFAQRQKKLAIAQALINGALAVTRILADVPKFDFGIATGILVGATVAETALQVGLIQAQQFAEGGEILDGPSHAQGGITLYRGDTGAPVAEVEGGERLFAINKHDSATIAAASLVNSRHGVSFDTPTRYAQAGGEIDTSTQDVGQQIQDALKGVTIITRVVDINNAQTIDSEVKNNAVI